MKIVVFVKRAESFGDYGQRVTEQEQIALVIDRAVKYGTPKVIEVIVERQTDAIMGIGLDTIREFAEIL